MQGVSLRQCRKAISVLNRAKGTNPSYTRHLIKCHDAGVTLLDKTETDVTFDAETHTGTAGVSGATYVYRFRAEKTNGRSGETDAVAVTIP